MRLQCARIADRAADHPAPLGGGHRMTENKAAEDAKPQQGRYKLHARQKLADRRERENEQEDRNGDANANKAGRPTFHFRWRAPSRVHLNRHVTADEDAAAKSYPRSAPATRRRVRRGRRRSPIPRGSSW